MIDTVVVYRIDRAALVRYAGASGDLNPIHYSPAAAAGCGLPDVVAHGMLLMGLAVRAAAGLAGGPAAVRASHARFLRPLPVPDGADGVEIALHATPRPGTPGSVSVVVSGGGEIVARVTVQVDR